MARRRKAKEAEIAAAKAEKMTPEEVAKGAAAEKARADAAAGSAVQQMERWAARAERKEWASTGPDRAPAELYPAPAPYMVVARRRVNELERSGADAETRDAKM